MASAPGQNTAAYVELVPAMPSGSNAPNNARPANVAVLCAMMVESPG